MFAKTPIIRSEPYRRWVASLPCIACGVEGLSQCAHANYGKGMSMKTCDTKTFPLCGPHWGLAGCHQAHDIGMTRTERRNTEDRYVEKMRDLAIASGWGVLFS